MLLDVGIGVCQTSGDATDWQVAARDIVDEAFASTGVLHPAKALMLLATADWCSTERPLSKLILSEAKRHLPYDIPLLGGSMPRIAVSRPCLGPKQFTRIDKGFVLIVLRSEDLWVTVGELEKPYDLPREIRLGKIRELAASLKARKCKRLGLGSSAATDLLGFFPGPLTMKDGSRAFFDIELHADVLRVFGDAFALFGASAADELWALKGFQFANDKCLESSLVLSLLEYDLAMGAAMSHGFKPIKDMVVSVDELAEPGMSASYEVKKLDGRPAGQRLRELMRDVEFCVPRPVLGMGTSENARIIVPVVQTDALTDSVRFNRHIPLHYRLAVLSATPADLVQNTKRTFELALNRAGVRENDVKLVLGFACASRFQQFDTNDPGSWWSAVRDFGGQMSGAPMVCALCSGEFAEDERLRPRGDNFSIWFSCLTGKPHPRSRNRRAQEKLLEAAEALQPLRVAKDVMRCAIEWAMKAGAIGGQVCICDAASRKILGGHHGVALSAPHSGVAYEETLKTTFRDLPARGTGYILTDFLKQWSRPVGRSAEIMDTLPIDSSVNILSVIAANNLAIFIPDSADAEFLCNPEGVRDGHLQAQFIAPLVGSDGQVLATIQIGFSLDFPMDRECMGLWIGYIQNVATILERALEIEEREATQAITNTGTILMTGPPPSTRFPEWELMEYLQKVTEVTGADYVQIRMRDQSDVARRYRLVAAKGELAELHRSVRPFLTDEDGSIAHARKHQELFANTAEETNRLHADAAKATAPSCANLADWAAAVSRVKSTGIIRITNSNDIVGALVLDSYAEYFFTERRKRVARLAAEKAAALIVKREADFLREQQSTREQWLFAASLLSVKAMHDLMRPLANIQGFTEVLQRRLGDTDRHSAEIIKKIQNNKEAAVHLLSDTHAHGSHLEFRLVTPSELISEAMHDMASMWRGAMLDDTEFDPPLRILSNRWLISAITNLMDNALESAASDTGTSLRVSSGEGMLYIDIDNDGVILSREDVEKIQSPGHSRKTGHHLGLGVTLAEFGIKYAKGQLSLTPRVEGGLSVRVKLPVYEREIQERKDASV